MYAITVSLFQDSYPYDSKESERSAKSWFGERKYLPPKWFVTISITAFILLSLIPSKETIYLVAGSEAAETVVTSETGQEVMSDLKEILKIQLDNLKGETK
jgi:hypothetical protein